jgi:hypothetical protein
MYDGNSIDDWEGGVDWTYIDPDWIEEDDGLHEYALGGARVGGVTLVGKHPGMDYVSFENSTAPPLYADLRNISDTPTLCFSTKVFRDHDRLQERLVTSFQVQYELGLLRWPKTFNSYQKTRLPVIPLAIRRARGECHRALYTLPSTYLAFTEETQSYSRSIGLGLFSRIQYKKGDVIAWFNGEIISQEEMLQKEEEGKGGYVVYICENVLLDCYEKCKDMICLASYANSSRNCWDTSTNSRAVNNASLSVDRETRTACLKATCIIPPEKEISWPYASSYYRFFN